MKKMMMTLALMLTMAINTFAMSYSEARTQSRFLSDKMAYELELSDAQYEAVYEINLDYLLAITEDSHLYGSYWTRRNNALEYVLTPWQLSAYRAAEYFYRPLSWANGRWQWHIYSRYSANRFYKSKPKAYSQYRGSSRQPNYYQNRSYAAPQQRRFTAPTTSTQTRQSWSIGDGKRTTTSSNSRKTSGSTRQFGNATRSNGNAQTTRQQTRTTSTTDIYRAQNQYDSSRKQQEKQLQKEQKQNQGQRRFGQK